MTIRITRVLSIEEHADLTEWGLAHGYWRNDRRLFQSGMAWFEPWYWDPTGTLKGEVYFDRGNSFLSIHYWNSWADKRPPISVVCPNGEEWEVDRKSSNGSGWIVTGDLPDITCTPSIVVDGYHGYLRDGLFTPDIEGRPPNGIPRAITAREGFTHPLPPPPIQP